DHHRKLRTGFGEVIFCKGKTKEQVAVIFDRLAARDTSVLATKATKEQYEAVLAVCPQAEYQENGGLITLIREQPQYIGEVAVCTAGTADIPVAEESAATAAFFGANVKRYYDVGVAGIHRLFDKLPEIERANVVIAVAGMEGALAGVLAGMIDKPVIAVPTSVGYGANFHGLSALLTMLNSCADGISVVNIDNGYGAGYLGAQINRLVTGKGEE
ncbi:MAG: nickel pincer cofactor biosynthesis protein LarB, partial [Clostridiales bacterium]|nr:nickel pincer cofactor biosynthesis protein LarB [Clostridiales bacterium]